MLTDIIIMNTQKEHGPGVYDTVRLAYGVPLAEECENCIDPEDVAEHLQRFPEGQFVAVYTGDNQHLVVGMAATMRTSHPPTDPPRKWIDEIGSTGIANHHPAGEWLYGVEMSVRPDFRLQGIGTALYHARFELVKRLGLKGWYAGGMLMGYRRYRKQMSVRNYGEKVISREIIDPTVTMQMNRGFEAWDVIEDYLDEPDAGNGAVLIVWNNPEYDET